MYVPTTKFVFHEMGPLVTGKRKHWRSKCDHDFIPYYLDKKYRREDTPVWLPVLLLISWNRENKFPLSLFVPEILVSRDGFGRPIPRHPAHSPNLAWI